MSSSGNDWAQPPPSYKQAIDGLSNTDLLLGPKQAPPDDKGSILDEKDGAGSPSSSSTRLDSDKVSEEELMMLARYDTVIIVDDSGSMLLPHGYPVGPQGMGAEETSRWAAVSIGICSRHMQLSDAHG
jgi:hypothetical protein